jgi:hypothetical protein
MDEDGPPSPTKEKRSIQVAGFRCATIAIAVATRNSPVTSPPREPDRSLRSTAVTTAGHRLTLASNFPAQLRFPPVSADGPLGYESG